MIKSIIILIFLLGLSWNSVQGQAAEQVQVERPDDIRLEQNFTQSELSVFELNAFKERGNQKLNDFVEHLNLLADIKLEQAIRESIVQSALQFFNNQESLIKTIVADKVTQSETIADYLNRLLKDKKNTTTFTVEQLPQNSSMQKDDNGDWFWDIQFQLLPTKATNGSAFFASVTIFLIKTEKKFGSQTKSIWQVFLGDITLNTNE